MNVQNFLEYLNFFENAGTKDLKKIRQDQQLKKVNIIVTSFGHCPLCFLGLGFAVVVSEY
jgi:hypothetical protein